MFNLQNLESIKNGFSYSIQLPHYFYIGVELVLDGWQIL